jgi:two-component system chemotaxis response regulator CheV
MIDLIVFSVENNRYALNIENVQRIIQSVELTTIPNAHPYIDGMMSYEDNVIKVLNFRKLTGLPLHVEDQNGVEESSQKLLFYEDEDGSFAIKVDNIDDISHIEESEIMSNDDDNVYDYIELSGILDLHGTLINIIKTIKLPS